MIILGIETSCDETSAAVVEFSDSENALGAILAQETATSLHLHAATGGIIPERAAREQLKYILPVIDKTLEEAFPNHSWKQKKEAPPIDAIGITYGPGLIGPLLVGVETAKTLSILWNKPLIPVNHLYGHIYANWLKIVISNTSERSHEISPHTGRNDREIEFPALALVVSGGHTDLVLMKNHHDVKVIGATRDDAAGEAFDKIGRLLGLSYPAGPEISKLAEKGDEKRFQLPRPMLGSGDFDFSFSGLKTAVLNLIKKNGWKFDNVILERSDNEVIESQQKEILSRSLPLQDDKRQLLYDLCASTQEAIIDVLVKKTVKAAKQYEVKSILLGGGVAANDKLRKQMEHFALNALPNAKLFVPQKALCTDNAAMIAAAAFFNKTITPWQEVTANPELYF